jgi:hypothetical protein
MLKQKLFSISAIIFPSLILNLYLLWHIYVVRSEGHPDKIADQISDALIDNFGI